MGNLASAKSPGAREQGLPFAELTFRALLPNESLIALAREQDALLRAVSSLDRTSTRVLIERHAEGQTFRASASADVGGEPRHGCAEHADGEWAVRLAFTALLRAVVDPSSQRRCAWAA